MRGSCVVLKSSVKEKLSLPKDGERINDGRDKVPDAEGHGGCSRTVPKCSKEGKTLADKIFPKKETVCKPIRGSGEEPRSLDRETSTETD